MEIILVHNGGIDLRSLAVLLRAAEERGDIRRFEALLRLPLPEHHFVSVPGGPVMVFGLTAPPRDDVEEVRVLLDLPKRHYRDLEYPHRSRRAALKRGNSARK